MSIEKKLIDTFEKWRYEDAAVNLSTEERQHVDEILRNDPIMAEYCNNCAESGMWKFYDALRDSVFRTIQISSGILVIGAGAKFISKLIKR